MAQYQAPTNLSLAIQLNLVAAQANGNLGTLASQPVAVSNYNRDTVDAGSTFTIDPTFVWLAVSPVNILGSLVVSGRVLLLL